MTTGVKPSLQGAGNTVLHTYKTVNTEIDNDEYRLRGPKSRTLNPLISVRAVNRPGNHERVTRKTLQCPSSHRRGHLPTQSPADACFSSSIIFENICRHSARVAVVSARSAESSPRATVSTADGSGSASLSNSSRSASSSQIEDAPAPTLATSTNDPVQRTV